MPALQGCGITQYDCSFGQNLCIICVCSFIACPYFRCKLREKHQIKVQVGQNLCDFEATLCLRFLFAQGNILFDILSCYCCGCLATFQEFREVGLRPPKRLSSEQKRTPPQPLPNTFFLCSTALQSAIRDGQFTTQTTGGKVVDLPTAVRLLIRRVLRSSLLQRPHPLDPPCSF